VSYSAGMRTAFALFLLAGCETKLSVTEPTNVDVSCETTKDALVCNVKQIVGTQEATACWEFSMTCANGTVIKAPKSCINVKGGGTGVHTIPRDKLVDADKCGGDKPPVAKVENLTINGKAPDVLKPH
jgi:hypothetical protein